MVPLNLRLALMPPSHLSQALLRPLVDNPAMPNALMSLLREPRDEIYRYLLLTARDVFQSQKFPRCYQLHPSILRVNKQISEEAGRVFYNENQFIRLILQADARNLYDEYRKWERGFHHRCCVSNKRFGPTSTVTLCDQWGPHDGDVDLDFEFIGDKGLCVLAQLLQDLINRVYSFPIFRITLSLSNQILRRGGAIQWDKLTPYLEVYGLGLIGGESAYRATEDIYISGRSWG